MNMKKLFLLNLPYLLFVYPFDKLAQAFRLAPGADLSGKLLSIGDGFTAALSSPWLSFHLTDLLIGIAGAVVLRMAVYLKGKNAKKYRHGIEYGSARWGTAADIAPYMDKDFFQNIPMTQTERITMASRPKQPKYARNKNILVIGGSGSGKTRFFCKPSLLQAHSSYVCTDPKGTLLPEIGTFLERKKYRIKCLNLINFRKSMRYNPLAYIRSEKDILKLVNALIMNTKGEGEKSSEDFWVKAERLYYSALIGYIWYEATEEEKNFITLLDLINASEAREDDETYQSPVDLLFSQLEEREPDHFAVKQYRKFKMAAGKTAKSILISCGSRLAPFDIPQLREIMSYDELELDRIGDRKTAVFFTISDTTPTYNFIVALTVQRKLSQNTTFQNGRKCHNTWLAGKIKCGRCGYALASLNARNGVTYLRCKQRADNKSCEGAGTLTAQSMEAFVYGEMVKKMRKFHTLKGGKEQSYNPKLTAARVALAKTESEIEKLLDTLSGANPLLLQYANTRIEELDAERQKQLRLVADLTANSVSASQIDSITGYLDDWESVSFDDKRKVVDILISQIDATSESVTIHWKI